jgi:hypothetical protein
VTLCAVCTWHVEMRSASFLVEPQNQVGRFVSSLVSKPVAMVSSGLVSKPVAMIFTNLISKLVTTGFPNIASKSVVGFLIKPKNQAGEGFPSLGLKTDSCF